MSSSQPLSPLIAPLEALGFTLNEARAYATLLERGAQTGYEVGQHAGIPRSAVYGVLRRLVTRGAARSLPAQGSTPERFVAIPVESLTSLLKLRFATTTASLEEAAKQVEPAAEAPDAFTVRGYDRVLEEAMRLAEHATHKLVLSGWPRELLKLATPLREAHARGVSITVFSHAAIPTDVADNARSFSYGLSEQDLEGFWRHRLVLVADDTTCLIGATEQGTEDNAVVSATKAIAELATSQIALDITLLANRQGIDVEDVMAKLLADRVGSLDVLITSPHAKAPKVAGKPPA
jgi:HTH-type transcriptional regulator, sugar sensing transcriptional regulator